MNCDLAFDLMTDPQGQGSQALRRHLDGCPRCRQMRATLAPALEWISSACADDDMDEPSVASIAVQPAARRAPGSATAEALDIARQSAAALSGHSVAAPDRTSRWTSVGLRCAALLAIGGFLALALVPGSRNRSPAVDDQVCRRREAATEAPARSAAQFRALIASCAACHGGDREVPAIDRRSGAIDRVPNLLPANRGWQDILVSLTKRQSPDHDDFLVQSEFAPGGPAADSPRCAMNPRTTPVLHRIVRPASALPDVAAVRCRSVSAA